MLKENRVKKVLIGLVKNKLIIFKLVTSVKKRKRLKKFLFRLVSKVMTSVKKERGIKSFS